MIVFTQSAREESNLRSFGLLFFPCHFWLVQTKTIVCVEKEAPTPPQSLYLTFCKYYLHTFLLSKYISNEEVDPC